MTQKQKIEELEKRLAQLEAREMHIVDRINSHETGIHMLYAQQQGAFMSLFRGIDSGLDFVAYSAAKGVKSVASFIKRPIKAKA